MLEFGKRAGIELTKIWIKGVCPTFTLKIHAVEL